MARRHSKILLSVLIACCAIAFAAGTVTLNATTVGQELENVQIKDSSNNPSMIPDLGAKVVTIFYTDPDKKDIQDPLIDAIKAKNFDKSKYRGVGIANLKDSGLPNFILRAAIRSKEKKYNSQVLTDTDLTLPKAWAFGDCNDTSVVVIIGKDKKVKYFYKGGVRGAEIDNVVKLIEDMIK